MKNLLYIGIRCNTNDIDGSAWNHHKDNLNYVFHRLNIKTTYFRLDKLNNCKFKFIPSLFIILRQIINQKRLIPFQEMIYLLRFYKSKQNKDLVRLILSNNFDIIFIEGSRLTFIIEEIKKLHNINRSKIVCDMDDLLSKRYK